MIYNKEFKGPLSTMVKLRAVQYRVYCNGAQGGRGYENGALNAQGGKGAYTSGVMQIKGSGTYFYLNVGGMGRHESPTGPNSGGYNGGGKGGKDIPSSSSKPDAPGGGDDASGGGGGATDIRIHINKLENRIMVTAGVSGGTFFCNGSPGGDHKGYYPSTEECNLYMQSDLVSETKGNANGVGSNGSDGSCTPGSGAGGGYRGGIARNHSSCHWTESSLMVAVSESSYISGHYNFKRNPNMIFNQTFMYNGGYKNYGNEGNGVLRIAAIYECPSECSDCSSGTYCISCFSYAYKYDNLCYLSCGELNKPSENNFFGNDVENKICYECDVDFCKNCVDDYRVCKECIEGFHIENGTCIHYPTTEFTFSESFTKSIDFTNSDLFSSSSEFSASSHFSPTLNFSSTFQFSLTDQFSISSQFSITSQFSFSSQFSSTSRLAPSLNFSPTFQFSSSSNFTISPAFNFSFTFCPSSIFTSSSTFYILSTFIGSKEF